MTVMLDRDIAGGGSDLLTGTSNLLFWTVHITNVGPEARPLEVAVPDHYLRLGWISLGDHFSEGTDPARDWWRQAVWLDFIDNLWTPPATGETTISFHVQATRIRWYLTPETTGHLYCFGE
jgi:hypothetical protein